MSLREEACWTTLIIAALYQAVLTSGPGRYPKPETCEGRRGRPATPRSTPHRRGRRMPAPRPILGLGLAERHCDEMRPVARLDPHEDRALALLLRVLESAAH